MPKAGRYLTLGSAEDLTQSELDTAWPQSRAKPWHQRPREGEKRDKRPPPPYPGPGKQALASARQPAESLLWRPQRPEEGSRTASEEPRATEQNPSTAYSGPAGDQNSKTLGDPEWLDWQRERWQIWELLSTDNPDALPETLV